MPLIDNLGSKQSLLGKYNTNPPNINTPKFIRQISVTKFSY